MIDGGRNDTIKSFDECTGILSLCSIFVSNTYYVVHNYFQIEEGMDALHAIEVFHTFYWALRFYRQVICEYHS